MLGLCRYTGQSTWEVPNGPPSSQSQAYVPAAASAHHQQQYTNQGMGATLQSQMQDPYGAAAYPRQSAPVSSPGSSDYAMYMGAVGTGANFGGASGYGAGANLMASNPYAYPQPQALPYGAGGAPGVQAPDSLRQSAFASPREHLASPPHAHTPFSHRSRQSSLHSSLAPSPNTRAAFLAQQSRSQQQSPLGAPSHPIRPTSAHASPHNVAPGVFARQQAPANVAQPGVFARPQVQDMGVPAYPMPPVVNAPPPVPSGQLQSEAMM